MPDNDDFDADFNAGFGSADTGKPTTTPEQVAEDVTQAAVAADPVATDPAKVDPVAAEPAAAAPAPVGAKPKFAKITEEQLARLVAKADEVDGLKTEHKRLLDSAFGKIGGMQQIIDQLKANTAAGMQIELTAEMKEAYPELSELLSKGKIKGTGTEAAVAAADPAHVQQLVEQGMAKARQEIEQASELKRLSRKHSDWKTVVSSPEYQAWLKMQPVKVQEDAATSWDSEVTIPIIGAFKESRKPAPAKEPVKADATSTRQQRLDAAVNPRGTGGHSSGPTEDDDFHAGFNSS